MTASASKSVEGRSLKLGASTRTGSPRGTNAPLRLVAISTASSGFSVKIAVTESCQEEGVTKMLHQVMRNLFELMRRVDEAH
jgi:hypothetical protein